jgi:dihydropteroate synthase
MAAKPITQRSDIHPASNRIEGEGVRLETGRRVLVMGILNVTPDSFSDGGRFASADEAIRRAEQLAAEGADLIDVGGESSRPGAEPITVDEELRRVLPVIEALAPRLRLPISIDTAKAAVAHRALAAGARVINDISALRFDPEMVRVAAESRAPIVLMHMRGTPRDMQREPRYTDVIGEIAGFFEERLRFCDAAGIPRARIVLDPGIGFGKTLQHNLEILRSLPRLAALGRPLLVGPSRKSFIGQILDLPVEQRLEGTAAAVAAAVLGGAAMVRVHDVAPMLRVVRVAEAIRAGEAPPR